MLGAEQSGFIADLGYETYQKILSEAVRELKTDEFADLYADELKGDGTISGEQFVDECQVESDLELLLPATYLSTTKLIFVLAAVAVSDTSAYFVGTRFGHHKLWPRVSPNKSSEGAVGSLVGCVIFCTIYGACLGSASWWAFALLGIAINAFAQLGDLFESALKRAVHVKDSSNLLPGHGGILDRADSILFAMPMFAVVDQWFFFF